MGYGLSDALELRKPGQRRSETTVINHLRIQKTSFSAVFIPSSCHHSKGLSQTFQRLPLYPSHICLHIHEERCSVSVGVNQRTGYAASTSVLARVKSECVLTKDAARVWLLAFESKPFLKDFIVVSAVQTQHSRARNSDMYIMAISQGNVSQNVSEVYK